MAVLYAGIDEAGYGPLLGPMTVSMAAFTIDRGAAEADEFPDLWRSLRRAVCRTAAGAKRRVAIADSKKLKLPNGQTGRHPLTHLERGVLAILASAGHEPCSDDDLCRLLGADFEDLPWYWPDPVSLPVAGDHAAVRLDAAAIRRAGTAAGVALTSLRCRLIGETAFNQGVRRHGSKAAVSGAAVASLIREAVRRWGHPAVADGPALRIVVDRQGGRTDYRDLLRRALPAGTPEMHRRSETEACYRISTPNGAVEVLFEVEAENRHMPVALASMTAKLIRELAMLRFNRYWCGRLPELKPTAGYRSDARRWLADAAPVLDEEDRRRLVRLA